MVRAHPRRVIRTARWFLFVACLACLLFVGGLAWSWSAEGVSFTSLGFVVMVGIGVAGVYEAVVSQVVLGDDELVVKNGFGTKRYPRSTIRRVTWAAGCPASIDTAEQGWVNLPELGQNTQGVVNSVRAWINRDGKVEDGERAAEELELTRSTGDVC